MDRNFINVLLLGLSFMFLFTAFQTGGMIQGTVVQSISSRRDDYNANGTISLSIIYAVFAVANWFAAAIVKYIGPRISMIVSGVTYVIFVANFLWPQVWLLYLVSGIVGVGAAIIWTGQGNYLTRSSTDEVMSRNSGVFWAMLQCSLLWGNIFVFFSFKTDDDGNVSDDTIRITYTVLTVLGAVGVASFFLLGKPTARPDETYNGITFITLVTGTFKESVKYLFTKKMALLSVTFVYTGLELSFYSGVYGTVIGNTNQLIEGDSPKKYIGLSGICIGAGEIVGGLAFGILGSKTKKLGRNIIVILGYTMHILAFVLVFINFPKGAGLGQTNEDGFIKPSMAIALVCSFILGFADSCYNTQIYSIVGTIYSDNSAPAFALFKFFQSIAAAGAFFYASAADIFVQLGILVVMATIGTVAFFIVERGVTNEVAKEPKLPKDISIKE